MPTTTITVGVPAYNPGTIGYFSDMTPKKAASLLMKCAKNYARAKHGRFGAKIPSAHKRSGSKGRSRVGKSGRFSVTTSRK